MQFGVPCFCLSECFCDMLANSMTSVAILCLLLLERFLASDMDDYTEPVLRNMRLIEESTGGYGGDKLPRDLHLRKRHLAKFVLFTSALGSAGQMLDIKDDRSFRYFDPRLDTKVIIHGFMDKVAIANWMHRMKDEFFLLEDLNVIIVDWSSGNFIPYSKAAANTEQVGEEISQLLATLLTHYGARAEKFHLLGHSLGSHVAGYVGERIKPIGRITGLDPATYLFSNASPRTKLDPSDALFVDVIHTDAGGIGMVEPVGHIDFYVNGGEVQPGCTASNSLRALLQDGVVEGVRNLICSHMRAPLLFTDTINTRHCQMLAHACASWESFLNGSCDTCEEAVGGDCATMGYNVDTRRIYGSRKYFLVTAESAPYCGYEYKIEINVLSERRKRGRRIFSNLFRKSGWSSSDILHISLYGDRGAAEFKIPGKQDRFQMTHVVLSRTYLGEVSGAVLRWGRNPLSRTVTVLSRVVTGSEAEYPVIESLDVTPLEDDTLWRRSPTFELCAPPMLFGEQNLQGATLRSDYC